MALPSHVTDPHTRVLLSVGPPRREYGDVYCAKLGLGDGSCDTG